MMRSWIWGAALLAAPGVVSAQAAPKFTAEQATAGKEVFERNCAPCHSVDLSGGPIAPPLYGGYFGQNWENRTVTQLFEFVSTEMPQTAPGSLDKDSYLRVIAYILSFNGLAAGNTPLAVGDPGVLKIPAK
jgi:mono/diheme cytochrome c family protein